MESYHLARTADQAEFIVPEGFSSISQGFRRWSVVNRKSGSVHQEFNICEMDAGGSIHAHIHTFEESIYILEGQLICETGDGKFALEAGDYGIIQVAAAHSLRNESSARVRWVEMLAPQPRIGKTDVYPVESLSYSGPPLPIDARNPRTRYFGNITTDHMDPTRQSQELLSLSGSMRTALMVYTGITVKMMIDGDLGAHLHTMFMVKYIPGGGASSHDHPFEETYMILDGQVDAWFDDHTYTLKPGDIAWAGVGCIHGFRNTTDTTVQWLETSVPGPPTRHAYRFARDWDYFEKFMKK